MRPSRVRRWIVRSGALVALVVGPALRAAPASALSLVVDDGTTVPCHGSSLCVEVSAQLSGVTAFGTETFVIALPVPDPALWTPSAATIEMGGSISIAGAYDTEEVRARQEPGAPFVMMGIFSEELAFADALGAALATFSIVQTMTCAPPPPDAGPSVACSDGNGGGGVRAFGPGALDWTQRPLSVSPTTFTTPPAPLAGTGSIDVRNAIRIEVVYDPIPEPSPAVLVLAGGLLLAAGRARLSRTTNDGGATP
jgi:hypothetical protein